ncbi:carbohydrate kinase family protein [Sinorhizobium meliloti]|jgi:sugar/nucleoside kinase (ribokinase family)|uniref:carbohydrate kinase family protein n=1 Tax=Rhizobium meliloti TaxID=382 RepID=UPI0020C09CBB|nr:carbohydrate kinase family protein [Sinorhizobium meliloti]
MVVNGPGPGSRHDVMVVGEYYFDLIFRGLPEVPKISADLWAEEFEWVPGAAYSTALAFARLGTSAGWWCQFGNDIFSRMILEEARRENIDDRLFIHLDRPLRRVSAAFSFVHDRGFISYAEEPDPLPTPEDLARIRPRILLLQGFSLDAERRRLIEAARELGITVCSDCQHVDYRLSTPGMEEMLGLIDVFLPNASEAKALTGEEEVERALSSIARFCPTVVVKCGADGAIAFSKGRTTRVPALAVEVFDTTGAGDCFNAGFVHGLLTEPDIGGAIKLGVICGSLAVTGYGGRNLPFKEDLTKYRRREAAI